MGSGSSCLRNKPPPSYNKITPSLNETIQTTTTISPPSSHQQIETGDISDDNDIQMSHKTSDEDDGIQLMYHFTDDIILEIFSTLPARPLIRCKSISHKFYQLVHEEFLRRTLVKPSPFSGFFYTKHYTSIPSPLIYFPIPNSPHPNLNTDLLPTTETILIGSTNGLLLFTHDRTVAFQCNVYVCDPVTCDFTVIPPPFRLEDTDRILMTGAIAYDPVVDPMSFKVVLFFAQIPSFAPHESDIMVFSSATRVWSSLTAPYIHRYHQAVYHRGTVFAHAGVKPRIFNFDVQNEVSRKELLIPKIHYFIESCIGVLRERFAFVCNTATSFNVYTLEDSQLDSGGRPEWLNIYSITGAVNPHFFAPCSFHPNQDVLFVQGRDYLVHAFQLEKDTLLELGKMEFMCPYKIHPFTHYPQAHLALH